MAPMQSQNGRIAFNHRFYIENLQTRPKSYLRETQQEVDMLHTSVLTAPPLSMECSRDQSSRSRDQSSQTGKSAAYNLPHSPWVQLVFGNKISQQLVIR